MTSRYHGHDLSGSKQRTIGTNISITISITALPSFFSGEPKSIERGENHYKSDHIEYFQYSSGIIRGLVHASMKEKSCKVTVSKLASSQHS